MGQIVNQMLLDTLLKWKDKLKVKRRVNSLNISDDIREAGCNKQSFELNYNGGTIWCEHLDGMGNLEQEVIQKFLADLPKFTRPSVSSYMIINLDETEITDTILETLVGSLIRCSKRFRKIIFVGIEKKYWGRLMDIQRHTGAICSFEDDYEKAKEWLFKR